jgi:hypothetical protein
MRVLEALRKFNLRIEDASTLLDTPSKILILWTRKEI